MLKKYILYFLIIAKFCDGVPLSTRLEPPPILQNLYEYQYYNLDEEDITNPEFTSDTVGKLAAILDAMIQKTYDENPNYAAVTKIQMKEMTKKFLKEHGASIEAALNHFKYNKESNDSIYLNAVNKNKAYKDLLKLVDNMFPGSDPHSKKIRRVMKNILKQNEHLIKSNMRPREANKRKDSNFNEIELDDNESDSSGTSSDDEISSSSSECEATEDDCGSGTSSSQEISDKEENNNEEENNESDDTSSSEEISDKDENNEAIDNNTNDNTKAQSTSGDGYDSDEPPGGGDGGGGGLLGLLAGLSGGENGQLDLGSLLATVGGILASLSGPGFDLNALIASGVGLLAGLLSEGMENPGTVVASYIITTLEAITGGGAMNNGAFFGNFVSRLLKGISAVPSESSDEENSAPVMKDSIGFIISLLSGLSGSSSSMHK